MYYLIAVRAVIVSWIWQALSLRHGRHCLEHGRGGILDTETTGIGVVIVGL